MCDVCVYDVYLCVYMIWMDCDVCMMYVYMISICVMWVYCVGVYVCKMCVCDMNEGVCVV